jgi:pyrimidine operon attenuation protein/uracil phosphoribosyltransferase
MTTLAESRTCLFDPNELNAVLDRMASQAMALLPGHSPVAVIGILRRGAPLADLLTERMVNAHGLKPPLRLDLSVKRYADDLTLLHPDTLLTEQAQHAALDLKGYTLLLVDDVFYTGHSILKVLPYLLQKNPAAIRVICLADRCTARLPVHADVVGLNLAIAPADILECHVPPYEAEFKIELVKPARTPSA